MSELDEKILKELQRQSVLMESLEKTQSETNGHLKVLGSLIVLIAAALFLMKIFSW